MYSVGNINDLGKTPKWIKRLGRVALPIVGGIAGGMLAPKITGYFRQGGMDPNQASNMTQQILQSTIGGREQNPYMPSEPPIQRPTSFFDRIGIPPNMVMPIMLGGGAILFLSLTRK